MDLRDSPEQARFRERLRAWLDANIPIGSEPRNLHDRWNRMRSFQRALYEGGWVALTYPTEFGGQGLGPAEEAILSEELALAGAPSLVPLGHLGRPLLSHGTDAQRARYLPPLLAVEEIWCQGFSEPEAGSDLASLRTTAVRDSDGWVLSGQKVWTSYGVFADFCLVLARTGTPQSRHRGISAFIVPLDAPGVSVRPLVLANGEEEFAEVFMDHVRVHADNILGNEGDGWAVAMHTITAERGSVDVGYLPKFEREFTELCRQIAETDAVHSPAVRDRLGRVAAGLEVMRMHTLRRLSERASGVVAGPETSIDKLLMTCVEQDLLAAALELSADHTDGRRAAWFGRYLYGRSASIYGGSAQVQKNTLAQRGLGLPRSP